MCFFHPRTQRFSGNQTKHDLFAWFHSEYYICFLFFFNILTMMDIIWHHSIWYIWKVFEKPLASPASVSCEPHFEGHCCIRHHFKAELQLDYLWVLWHHEFQFFFLILSLAHRQNTQFVLCLNPKPLDGSIVIGVESNDSSTSIE